MIKTIRKHSIKSKETQETILDFPWRRCTKQILLDFKKLSDSRNSIQEVKSMNDEILALK